MLQPLRWSRMVKTSSKWQPADLSTAWLGWGHSKVVLQQYEQKAARGVSWPLARPSGHTQLAAAAQPVAESLAMRSLVLRRTHSVHVRDPFGAICPLACPRPLFPSRPSSERPRRRPPPCPGHAAAAPSAAFSRELLATTCAPPQCPPSSQPCRASGCRGAFSAFGGHALSMAPPPLVATARGAARGAAALRSVQAALLAHP